MAKLARDNSSATIEVRMRPPQAQWRYRMDVFADGKRVYFDRSSLKIQHFPGKFIIKIIEEKYKTNLKAKMKLNVELIFFTGVTVYTPTYILNQSEVIIMFQSGAGVEVVENQGFMTARAYLPWSFVVRT